MPLTAVPDLLLRVPLKEDDPGRLPEGVRLPLPLPLGEALLPPLELEEWAEEEEPPCEEEPPPELPECADPEEPECPDELPLAPEEPEAPDE